jgi:NADPH:quinone reductase-like Zn-dependent oxidoreductase
MRAYELRDTHGIDSIVLAERPVPGIAANEILIRIRAVSINRSDLSVTRGLYRQDTPLPLVPCSDGVGEVVETGAKVTRWRSGDRVSPLFMPNWIDGQLTSAITRKAIGRTVDGMLAEYVAAQEQSVVQVPEHLSDEEAATLPTAALTAWNALAREDPGPESVLTLGTGGVSIFAAQFAATRGDRVIATSGAAGKVGRLRALGVQDVINYHETPDWEKRVRELTGTGVDRVIEVGGAGTLDRSLRAVRVGGQVSLIGALAGRGQVDPLPIIMKAIRVQGIYVGSRRMFESMNRFIVTHLLRPVVDRTFGFDEVHEALRYLETGRHFGKICIRVG